MDEKAIELKQYMTQDHLSKYICDSFIKKTDKDILEPSCGTGSFLKNIPNDRNVHAVELDSDFYHSIQRTCSDCRGKCTYNDSKYMSFQDTHGYTKIFFENFLNFDTDNRYDLIIGNPPYGYYGKGEATLDVEFVKKSLRLLKPEGRIVFLLETKFLHGIQRYREIWANAGSLLSLTLLARRPSFGDFKGTGKRDCSIFEIVKKSSYVKTEVNWVLLER